MRLTGIFLAASLFVSVTFGQDRAAKDAQAKQDFLDSYFFADNKGMHQFPNIITYIEKLFGVKAWNEPGTFNENDKYNSRSIIPENLGIQVVGGRFVGVFRNDGQTYKLGVAGCVICHSGRAAGEFIPGLGNKNINLGEFNKVGLKLPNFIHSILPKFQSDPEKDEVINSSKRMQKILSNPSFVSPTDGLIEDNIVIRTFYEAFGKPYDDRPKYYLNKIPFLWGIEKKKEAGLFYNGAGDPDALGWFVAVEIMWGQKADTIEKKPGYKDKIQKVEEDLDALLPPPYPSKYKMNSEWAAAGKIVYENTCVQCHGTYERDQQGFPIFKAPILTAVSEVQTDGLRANFLMEREFWNFARESSFRNLIKPAPGFEGRVPSYIAPRLEGIWSRFPYLHNGSVPTLWHLLHPLQRPEFFSLINAGEEYRFDPLKVGLTTDDADSPLLSRMGRLGVRNVFWTGRQKGHSALGHLYGMNLTEEQKQNLIEYLKTL